VWKHTTQAEKAQGLNLGFQNSPAGNRGKNERRWEMEIEELKKKIEDLKSANLAAKKELAKELDRILDIRYKGEFELPGGVIIDFQDCLCDPNCNFDGYFLIEVRTPHECGSECEWNCDVEYDTRPAEPEEVVSAIIRHLRDRVAALQETVNKRNRLIKSLRSCR